MNRSLSLLLLAACTGQSVHLTPELAPDAGVDGPPPDANPCDYSEAHDTTNDDNSDPSAIELTGLSFPGTHTLCGVINNGHYGSTFDTVDDDNYEITIGDNGSASSDLGFILSAPGAGDEILAVGGEVSITLSDLEGNPVAGGFVSVDIAGVKAFSLIQSGNYQLNVDAFGTGSDITTSLPYVITIVGAY